VRLAAGAVEIEVDDRLHGRVRGIVDDVVLRRNDGVPAYNLAVVVDDAAQGVTQVVRGDDLLPVTPTQVLLHHLLDLPVPEYLHVPLVLGADGHRLAKRHGAVTVAEVRAADASPEQVVGVLAASLGLRDDATPCAAHDLVGAFDVGRLRREPWTVPDGLTWHDRAL
jgi:glutamyl-tRNA synthetase